MVRSIVTVTSFVICLWTSHGFVVTHHVPLTGRHAIVIDRHVAPLSMTATNVLSTTVALRKNSTFVSEIPVGTSDSTRTIIDYDEPPTLGQVRKLLPAEVFQVDTATSLFYFMVDFIAVAGTMGFLNLVVASDIYHGLPWWNQALVVAPLQVLTGFAMWCMWCIGMSPLVAN